MPDPSPKPPATPDQTPGRGFFGWLGRQFGHVKKAVDTDVTADAPKTIYRDKRVEEKSLPQDPSVKLRRTVIDEVIQEKPSQKTE
jgi:hypothetical protein